MKVGQAINPSLLNVEVGCQLGPLCVPDLVCDKSNLLVPRVFIEFLRLGKVYLRMYLFRVLCGFNCEF